MDTPKSVYEPYIKMSTFNREGAASADPSLSPGTSVKNVRLHLRGMGEHTERKPFKLEKLMKGSSPE